ncbi:GNAT family N-acetyltransferase [Acidovorax sp. BL-A-41-H1]|uniref:GNAT family N-acetyltransferase n=1 Tax=Acidovorax sp. BL-A-41-H1 TaxID=3421102 RepID=UPI003F7B0F18
MAEENTIIARVLASPLDVDKAAWNALLARQAHPTPFMRHEYLAALHESGSAILRTGWTPRFMTLWDGEELVAACPLYLKNHSYGEYVFDWAWANAYEQHGVPYYPKAVIAVPFTPVPGSRLLARDAATRALLVQAVTQWCEDEAISSVHMLFAADDDVQTSAEQGLMLRHTVQFHWKNVAPTLPAAHGSLPPEGALPALGRPGGGEAAAPTLPAAHGSPTPEGALTGLGRPFESFDDFLTSLSQHKRKKIRQERRRVAEAGVTFRWARGTDISAADWDFFYRCYERTYLEHGNPPYLTRAFFAAMAAEMPEAWLLFVAERDGQPIATSLIAISAYESSAIGQNDLKMVAYGRYWGALERVDCLHFEACYYQPLAWCIDHGAVRFEGGAQGEHKMARALLPVQTTSTHWLAHPAFAEAVERFLEREGQGVNAYLESLNERLPFRQGT